jgi:cell fate regulator YaaT (PSP1 superfamily)
LTEVISVRFKNKGKVYFFDPAGFKVEQGENVIVETAKGLEYAECVGGNHGVEDTSVRPPLRPVVRVATEEDRIRAEENHRREIEAFEICKEKIQKHELDMKLVDVEYNFEGSKILFFFTSEGRVDFRELVKDLASVFKTRIELRQIGVRDEARMLGGLGICGRPFCCAQFLDDFQPVSIKMAKTQGFSLNPTKISGACGRLMCCLKYEQDAYEELVKLVPKVDSFVETPSGVGTVLDVNLLKSTARVRLEDQSDVNIKTFNADEITVLGGKAKRAEYLAQKAEEKAKEPEQKPKFTQKTEKSAQPIKEETPIEQKKQTGTRKKKQPQQEAQNQNKVQIQNQKPKQEHQNKNQTNQPKQNHQPKQQTETQESQSEKPAQSSAQNNRRYRRRRPSNGGQKPQGE